MTRFAAARTALLPAFPDSAPADLRQTLTDGGPSLVELILAQQLGPLWHARTQAEAFTASHMHAAKLYLRQWAALREIDSIFSHRAIRYAIIKGAATRERTFDEPAVRLCSDIDLLVAPGQRVDAARALVGAGYQLRVDPSLASHEVVLSKDAVALDLHWDILRPGRTRVPVTEGLLARRQQHRGIWMLADDDALFLMLVHVAIAKHLSGDQLGLHRIADIVVWCRRRDVDWERVQHQLEESGLKTAGWAVLTWVRMLSPAAPSGVVDLAIDSVRPSRLRAGYLKTWLNLNLSSQFKRVHALRLLAFSLFLHDTPSDAWRALEGWRQSRTTSETDALAFESINRQKTAHD